MKKVFSKVSEQIEILKNKNLIITDEQKATEILLKYNYYVLINGYRGPFVNEKGYDDKTTYIKGSTFDEIFNFYIFDRDIRIIFLKYMLIVEQNFKSAISYEFSKIYGYEDYLKFENFDCENEKNIREIFYLMGTLHNSLSRAIGKNDYITYNIEKYNNVPLWVLSNVITLGGIISFYKLMKPAEKEYLSKKYFRVKSDELEDYMEIINFFRNVCAHDERLYNTKTKVFMPKNEFTDYFDIKIENQSGYRDVFALVITLCMLLTKEEEIKIISELEKEFDNLESKVNKKSVEKIYNIMGFPENWRDIKNLNF